MVKDFGGVSLVSSGSFMMGDAIAKHEGSEVGLNFVSIRKCRLEVMVQGMNDQVWLHAADVTGPKCDEEQTAA
jgi:hypothetical protein